MVTWPRRLSPVLSALALFAALSCAPPPAKTVAAPAPSAQDMFVRALEEEATGDPARALRLYLDALDEAVTSSDETSALLVAAATVDALVERRVTPLERVVEDNALVFRSRERAFAEGRLRHAFEVSRFALPRAVLARSLLILAEARGAEVDASNLRRESGCATEALVVGPTSYTEVAVLKTNSTVDVAKVQASPDASSRGGVTGHGCLLPLGGQSPLLGVRDVLMDVEVPSDMDVSFVLRSTRAATLFAGDELVLERPRAFGDELSAAFGRVSATHGTLRVVVRVAGMPGESIELSVVGAGGRPLAVHAPVASSATVSVVAPRPPATPSFDATLFASRHGADEASFHVMAAAAALDIGRPAVAVAELAAVPKGPLGAHAALLEARATHRASDLSRAVRASLLLPLYERVLSAWPGAWEAIVGHAMLVGSRRATAGDLDALRDLDEHRAGANALAAAPLDAFDAVTSARSDLGDRAKGALARLADEAPGTALLFAARVSATKLDLREQGNVYCSDPLAPRNTLGCHYARVAMGETDAAFAELARLRRLFGAPRRLLAEELSLSRIAGDRARERDAFEQMAPTAKTLGAYLHAKGDAANADELLSLAASASDSPSALLSAFALLPKPPGDDSPLVRLEKRAESVIREERARPKGDGAATAILLHDEQFTVLPSGVVHFVLEDVRRLAGTTDIDTNAEPQLPEVGPSTRWSARALRRRVFKADGRVVEPDPAASSSQSAADLAELEAGDIVESAYEGWGVEGGGRLTIASADLLPERTSVRDATFELVLPSTLHGDFVSHPLLGPPSIERTSDTTTYRFAIHDAEVRRIEDGLARMDRAVRFVYSTVKWTDVALLLRDAEAALEDADPRIDAWARGLVSEGETDDKKVDAVVRGVGRALPKGQASPLDDWNGTLIDRTFVTARTFLSEREGSRTWLVLRALRALGIPADLVVAEGLPYSSAPNFPALSGRFTHPLVVAHVKRGQEQRDEWIDADVKGPPLPPGRVSDELLGRTVLLGDGSFGVVPRETAGAVGDAITIDLAVTPEGDAKGEVSLVLVSREAQELADSLARSVGAERETALRDVVLSWVPAATIERVDLRSRDDAWQVEIHAVVRIAAYARKSAPKDGAVTWTLPGLDPLHSHHFRTHAATLGATYASVGGRTSALAIAASTRYQIRRTVALPEAVVPIRIPDTVAVQASHLQGGRKIAVSGDKVTEEFSLSLETGTVSASDYPAFVEASHAIDDGFLSGVRLRGP